jgi:hypothetical protein
MPPTLESEEWKKVNDSTSRLEVPGGYLYRVITRPGEPSHIVFVADMHHTLMKAAFHLGSGNASTDMGAIEGHSVVVKEAGDRIAHALDALAQAVESRT